MQSPVGVVMPERESLKELKIGIADIILSFMGQVSGGGLIIDNSYKQFITDGAPDILLRVYYGKIPSYSPDQIVFDSGSTWSSYRCREKYILQDCFLEPSSYPETLIILQDGFEFGEIHINNDNPAGGSSYVMGHPLDQVLLINLLSLGRGVLFHACGVSDRGRGYLFLGNSTHGKSTMARIWFEGGATVLNDARIVVREKNGIFCMYGTPWHGDYPEFSAQGVPIDKVFFLHPGKENLAIPRDRREAVSMLLTRCFPPFWDKKGMEYTLAFCHCLVEKVACSELDFMPNEKVVDFVRRVRS